MDPVLSAKERIILDPKKRPFCNAFTGKSHMSEYGYII